MERFISIKESRGEKAMEPVLSKETVDNILRRLMLAFQYKPSTENEYKEMLSLYYNSLSKSGVSEKKLIDVAGNMVFTWKPEFGRKFPSVKEIVDKAGVSPISIAEKAHGVIKNKIMTVGGYEPLSLGFDHRHFVAMEVIRKMGGWFAVCQQGPEVWENNKNRFKEKFEQLYYEKEIPKKPLLGQSDLRNQEFLSEYNKNQIENKT